MKIIERVRTWTRRSRPAGDAGVFALAPIGIATFSRDGRFLSANPAFCGFVGYAEDELRRLNMEEVTHPEDVQACRELFLRVASGGFPRDMEKRFVRKDGGLAWAHVVLARGPEQGGAEGIFIGAALDLTERHATEQRFKAELEDRVAERTALLKAQQETSPDGILVVDPAGHILSYNSRFVEMWGLTADVLASRSDDRALRSVIGKLEDPEAFVRRVSALYSDRQARSFDEIRLLDGRVFERHSSPIAASSRHYGRIWFFRDVSSRVERERLLREKTAELQRSNADLEVYAYAASHDLSAPVRKIATLGAVLERQAGAKLGAEERRMLGRIRGAAEGLASLIKELLALSLIGREPRPPELVDLRAILAEVMEDMGAALRRAGAEVDIGSLPCLRAHRGLLYRLIQNLVANAVKFHRDGEPCRIRVESRRADGGVEIVIRDNGIGFEPRFSKKIFEPFGRLHPASLYEGHGIGLTVCQRVAGRYGGRISAQGVPGLGATFVIWLPADMVER
jgi:PAS domain S-box-containing protein